MLGEILIEMKRNEALSKVELGAMDDTYEIWATYFAELKDERLKATRSRRKKKVIIKEYNDSIAVLKKRCEQLKKEIIEEYRRIEKGLQKELTTQKAKK